MLNLKEYEIELTIFKKNLATFSERDQNKLIKAFDFASTYHENQIYQPNHPFIIHPIGVFNILFEIGTRNTNILCAGLLHDTVEDTNLTLKDINNIFGKRIADLVRGLTRERTVRELIGFESEEHHFKIKFRKYKKTLLESHSVRLIKCADMFCNMNHWTHIPKNHLWARKFPRYLKEAELMYLPLAKITNKKLFILMQKSLINFRKYLKNNRLTLD